MSEIQKSTSSCLKELIATASIGEANDTTIDKLDESVIGRNTSLGVLVLSCQIQECDLICFYDNDRNTLKEFRLSTTNVACEQS